MKLPALGTENPQRTKTTGTLFSGKPRAGLFEQRRSRCPGLAPGLQTATACTGAGYRHFPLYRTDIESALLGRPHYGYSERHPTGLPGNQRDANIILRFPIPGFCQFCSPHRLRTAMAFLQQYQNHRLCETMPVIQTIPQPFIQKNIERPAPRQPGCTR